VKHAPGFAIVQTDTGGYALRTAAGFLHPIEATAHPASSDFAWPGAVPDGFQFSATELRQAVEGIRECAFIEDDRPELAWEADFDDGLTPEQWEAVYGATAA
jgi:hypothetical protein